MLAHKAEEEGVFVAETIAGQKPHIDYNLIPGVVYTWPEVAAVGQTEEQLKAAGIAYKSGQFPMRALGRSRASMDIDGFVKILADKTTDEVLGVHMVGARAADMIAEAVVAMEYRASAEDISRMSHAHPTYTEAIKEAALAATEDRALHIKKFKILVYKKRGFRPLFLHNVIVFFSYYVCCNFYHHAF